MTKPSEAWICEYGMYEGMVVVTSFHVLAWFIRIMPTMTICGHFSSRRIA
jgi:hypothetical protein